MVQQQYQAGARPSDGGSPVAEPPGDESGPIEMSIVLPCLNEARTLATCIGKAQGFLRRHGVCGEVVIGDNGSSDGSQEIARRCGARVVDVPVRGYGSAVCGATLAARGRYVIMADSDDSYDLANLGPFLDRLRQGCELVMGNRFQGGIAPRAMPWKNRLIGNPVLSGVGRLLFHCPVRDLHCGLRGYSRQAFLRMNLRATGMEFASEMVIKACLLGMRIAEVPTTLSPDGRGRPPHLNPWRDGWRHLRFMLLFSPRWLFLYPGLAAAAVGLGVGLWLLPSPRPVAGVVLDIHTLLLAMVLALAGIQAVYFAVISKVFALTEGLHPPAPKLDKVFRHVRLETGLLAGGVLSLLGLGGFAYSVGLWEQQAFGPLLPSQVLRVLVPAAFLFLLGLQTIFTSFLLSVLGLPRK